MKVKASTLLALGIAAMLSGTAASNSATCDEQCLKGFVDRYLQALSAHDPAHLPVARNVRFTENGVQIPLGEALWRTFRKPGSYRHDFYDPDAGGVASYLTIQENDFPDFLSLRLKVVNQQITEIETVVVRGAERATTMPAVEPIWDEVEPAATRLTREQLEKGAVDYMRAIVFENGSLAPFAESCIRLENGGVMSLGPNDKPPVPMPPLAPAIANSDQWFVAVRNTMGMGCAKQLDTKVYAFINSYDNPRFPVVDVRRQIVYGYFNFRRRGTVKDVKMPDGKTYQMMPSTQWPNEVLNTEAWKFRNGRITRIEAVFKADQTYKTGTGWPGGRHGESRPND
ncbi:MAG: hypothetical protein JWN43_697 [Gammaproteobacteria bacterium]|nr:hypothetical protein [Gammaproteobacteria bacterium]